MDTQVNQHERDTIQVVLLEPGKQARITEIGASLEEMQAAVGGYIEAIYPFSEEVALVCNEEAKLIGMPLNRALRQEESGEILDIIAGPCFLCDCAGENFGSLSREQAVRYANQFRFPEQFFRVNEEIVAIPYAPPAQRSHNDKDRQER